MRRPTLVAAALLLVAFGHGLAQVAGRSADAADALAPARAALLRQDGAAAIALLDPLLAADPARIDARSLRAFARLAVKDDAGAIADFADIVARAPAQPAGLEARFAHADLLARAGKLAEAATQTADGVALLRSEARRHELVALYVAMADSFLRPQPPAPGTAATAPNPSHALLLLQRAEELGALGDDLPRVAIDVLRCLHATQQEPEQVVRRARELRAAFPQHADLAEADFIEGHAHAQLDEPGPTVAAWRRGAERAAAPFAVKCLDALARWALARKNPSDLALAAQTATDALRAAPTDPLVAPLVLDVALELHTDAAARPRAAVLADAFMEAFPQHPRFAEAALFRAGAATRDIPDAIARYTAFLAARPADLQSRTAAEAVATLRFAYANQASFRAGGVPRAERAEAFAVARERWNAFLVAAPLDARVPKALVFLAALDAAEDKLDEALARYAEVRRRFPGDEAAADAAMRSATLFAEKKHAFDAAFAALAEVPTTSAHAPEAARMSALYRAEELTLDSAVLAPGAPAALTLHVRNLERAAIALYRVRLDDLFTANGDLRALDAIDVSLIQPDRSFELPVEGYAPHRRFDVRVPLGDDATPGALVVTARGNARVARAVALISGTALAAVVSHSGIDALTFDRASGTAQDGATIAAGFDGVVAPAGALEAPKPAVRTIGLFARAPSGPAFALGTNLVALPPPRIDPAAGALFAESLTYRPADTIHVAGIARDARDGVACAFGADDPLFLAWVDDTSGSVLARERVVPSADGIVHGRFTLPRGATPPRTVRCVLQHDVAGANAQPLDSVTFTVQRFAATATDIVVEPLDPKAPPLVAGGRARYVARVRAPSGEPLAHEEVWLRLGRGAPVRHLSDALGRVVFDVEGEATARAGSVAVDVRVLGDQLVQPIVIGVDRVLWAAADDASPTAVVGEPFTFELRATNAAGAPVPNATARLVVKALGREDAAVELALVADAEGRARATFTPRRATDHSADVAWTDADGAARLETFELEAIGDAESDAPPSLRVLARDAHVLAGATAHLRVHSKLADGPAWVLVHARRLTHSATIELKRGWNDIAVPTPPLPAAACRVSVLAARDGRASRALLDLAFEAPLRAELTLSETPDGTRRAVLQVTDASRAPIAADAALWLVPAARSGDLAAAVDAQTDRWLDSAASAAQVLFSADDALPSSTGAVDSTLESALHDIEAVAKSDAAPVLVDSLRLKGLVEDRTMPGAAAGEADSVTGGTSFGQGASYGGRAKKSGRVRREDDRKPATDTATYFAPALARKLDARTGADGRLTWDLPNVERAGAYAVVALASAGPARVAAATKSFDVVHDVDVRVVTPATLSIDDRARVPVDLENRTATARTLDVVLQSTLAAGEVRRSVTLEPFGVERLALELPALAPGTGTIVVRVAERAFERPLVVLPAGVVQTVAAAATDAAERSALALPAGAPIAPATLVLDASAVAALLSLAEESDADDVPGDLRAASLRLWTEAEALLAARSAADAEPRRAAIRAQAQRRLDRLVWWIADDAAFEPLLALALARARDAGLAPPERLHAWCEINLAALVQAAADDAEHAWLLFCRGTITDQDFGRVNRLLRAKGSAAARTLAPLAVALARAGRTAEASEVFAALRTRLAPGQPAPDADPLASVSPLEIGALALDAGRTLHASAPDVESFAAVLEATASPALDGRLARVLALRSEAAAAPAAGARLEALAGGVAIATLAAAPPWQSVRVAVDSDALASGIEVVRSGAPSGARARLAQRRATPLDALASTGVSAAVRMMRHRELRDGVRVQSGDSIVGSDQRTLNWNDPVTFAPSRTVGFALMLDYTEARTRDAWWFVPRVAGFTLEVTYGATRVLEDERGTWIFVRRTSTRGSPGIQVEVAAAQPGTYVLPPLTLGRAPGSFHARTTMNGPETIATDAGMDGADAVAWTPDERFYAGKAAFERRDLPRARELLRPLAELTLDPQALLQTNRMLLLCAVAANDAAEQVRCFEIAKERDAEFIVPFDATLLVGAAYRELGEFERSRQVFLAVADAGFLEEAQIVGVFEQVGRQREAIESMTRLLRENPDTELVRQTAFAHAQRATTLARAAEASPQDARRAALAAFLWDTAVATLEQRAIEAPAAADVAEVLLTLADAHRERRAYAASDAVARAALLRKDLGRLEPAFQYERAFAALAEQRLDDALAAARVLADAGKAFPLDAAVLRLAAQGRHLEAQILQVNGDFDGARKAYALVKDQFDDAARELDFLERAALDVDELTTVKSGEPLRVAARIHGAAKTVDVLAYKVDLRLLYLKQRGFERLRDVQLAGLPPFRTFSVPIPAGSAAALKLDLDLPDAGAYLLVLRAGEQQARALAIRSDLALDVRDDAATRVRVHVWRADTGAKADGATVTFFGAGSGRFETRKSDLRGVAEVEGLEGRVALVAEKDGHYAFFQGAVEHGAPRLGEIRKAENKAMDVEQRRGEQNELLNDSQFRNAETWKENTNRRQQGVEVERAKR